MARGNLYRFGPAEPGLNSSVGPYRSIVGWCVCPKTQTSGCSRSRNARPSFVNFPPSYSTCLIAMRRPASQEKTLERIRAWRGIAPGLALLGGEQRGVGLALVQPGGDDLDVATASGRSGFDFDQWHECYSVAWNVMSCPAARLT